MRRRFLASGQGAPEGRTRSRAPRIERLEDRRLLAILTVNSTSDSNSTADATLSLREAIEVSNGSLAVSALSTQQQAQVVGALSSPNTIDFDIPTTDPGYSASTRSWTIAPQSVLPTVTAAAFINGYSQPGALANTNGPGQGMNTVLTVEINGSGSSVVLNGLTISAGDSTVSGLVVDGFNIGIHLVGQGGDTVEGCFIGADITGKVRAGSNTGLEFDSVGNVTVGGTAAGAGNLISGNVVGMLSSQTVPTVTDDLVEGNFIGADVTGTQALDNVNGIELANDSGDTIGGTTAAAGNLISGNTFHEISVGLNSQVSTDTLVEGNLLGTDVTGAKAIGNGFEAASGAAVELIGGGNTVGGSASGAGNIIADNTFHAIEVAQGSGNLISRNAIFGNAQGGILMDVGANAGVTAPVIRTVTPNADGTVTVQGAVANETPGDTLTIELFANATNETVGLEQGQAFQASEPVAADSGGNGGFSFTLAPPAGAVYLTVTATSAQYGTSAFGNSMGAPVSPPVDLAVTAALDPGPIAVGNPLGYTFTVANVGTTMAAGVFLEHLLPTQASFVSAGASQGTAAENAGVVTAAFGDIAGGANAALHIVVQPQFTGSMIELAGDIHTNQLVINPFATATSIPIDVSPAAPTNAAAKVVAGAGGSSTIQVSWKYTNPPGGAATFNVYRSETPGGEGTTPYRTGVTTDQFSDAGIVPGHVYYYQVTAMIGGLESLHSNEALGTILTAPAITSIDDVPMLDGSTAATIHWTYPAAVGASVTFNIYRSTMPGGEGASPYRTGAGEDASQTSIFAGAFTDGLVPGSTYYYQVSAVVAGAEGPRSAEAKTTIPGLLAPVLVQVGDAVPLTGGLDGGLDDVQIVWSNVYTGAKSVSFNLYAATTPGGEGASPYEQAVSYGATSEPSGIYQGGGGNGLSSSGQENPPEFDRTFVTQHISTTYYYQIVEVVDVNGVLVPSPRSNEVAVTVPGPPVPVSHLVRIHVQIPTIAFRRSSSATDVVLDFSNALNAVDAQNAAAYRLVTLGKLGKKSGHRATKPLKVASASYNPVTNAVTLTIKGKLPNQQLELSVNTSAVLDSSGLPIAGVSGQSGSVLQATFGKKGITF